jgi:hypothetical protein
MSHLDSIGAGRFSDLSVATPATPITAEPVDEPAYVLLFASDTAFERIENVREFPAMGTPPNIVNVPVYGQATTQQIQGQSDAPTLELTINYVASDWAKTATLGAMVGNGVLYAFRFTLLDSEVTNWEAKTTGPSIGGEDAEADNKIKNSSYYWIGKIEALMVNPQLTDASTATVTISVQSDFNGAYTITNV